MGNVRPPSVSRLGPRYSRHMEVMNNPQTISRPSALVSARLETAALRPRLYLHLFPDQISVQDGRAEPRVYRYVKVIPKSQETYL